MLLSTLLRALVLLRQAIAMLLCGLCLLGAIVLALPYAPAAARPLANVPTASPAPPTAEPPTAEPPTAEPPTAEPPTAEPPAAEPPPSPTPTAPPERPERRRPPTETAAPPTPTSAPEPSPTAPPAAEILIDKGVDAEQLRRGDTARYSIRVSNIGGSLARDVVVSDEVPPELEIIDLQSSKGDIVASGQRVTAYPAALEPGEEAALLVGVRVRADAPAGLLVNIAQVTTSSPGDDPGNNSDSARLTVVVPAAGPPLAQRLPRTAEVALGPTLPWWLPWLATALGLMVFGALLTYRVEPALRRMVAAQAQQNGASLSRRPLAPPRPRRPLGRPARRPGYVRQAPGRNSEPEPVTMIARQPETCPEAASEAPYAVWSAGESLALVVRRAQRGNRSTAAGAAREQVLRAIDAELARAHAQLVEQRLRLLRESAALPPERAGRNRIGISGGRRASAQSAARRTP
jgi:uncharacterized repeat protein (TIGR01451 family)